MSMMIRFRFALYALVLYGMVGLLVGGCGPEVTCSYGGKSHKVGVSFSADDGCNTCTCGASGDIQCTQKECVMECGGPSKKACPTGFKCIYKAGSCGDTSAVGVCRELAVCQKELDPICDCNGVSHKAPCWSKDGRFASKGNCASCLHQGLTYKSGETFPAGDKCNTCTCKVGKVTCTQKSCLKGCKSDGQSYKHGESWDRQDGCSRCTCRDGKHDCKPLPCKKPCKDKLSGKEYQPGESYLTPDGCEKCTCGESGSIACVEAPCGVCTHEGKTYQPGETFPAKDSCNSCVCKNGKVECTTKTCVKKCGEPGDPPCAANEVCVPDFTGDCQGTAGRCQPKTTCDETDSPVCGCDGKTYLNFCTAQQMGIKLRTRAEACKEKQSCGTRGTGRCQTGFFCDFSIRCGSTDLPGKCEEIPSSCGTEKKPVCGCNGKTYDNACLAFKESISIKFEGKCP